MRDDLRTDADGVGDSSGGPADADPPFADREVPLDTRRGAFGEMMHAWLDGEAPESSARRSEPAAHVALWKRLDAELAGRRRMRAPAGVEMRIMAALPATPHD